MAEQQPMMRRDGFDLPISSLHPDWHADWGVSLSAQRNRKSILDNPRLARRPGADLARQLGIPMLVEGAVGAADLHAFQVMGKGPARFIHLVGLASLAPVFASVIDGKSLRSMQAEFPLDDLKIALSCRDLVPAKLDTEIDRTRLKVVVETTGPRMIQAWAERLPAELRGRIRFMLPKSLIASIGAQNQPIVNHDPGKVIQRVAELISPLGLREKPHHGWS